MFSGMKIKIKFIRKIINYIKQLSEHPIRISLVVLLVLSVFVLGLSLPYYLYDFKNFFPQILAEAHGMLFDIAIIGILIFWLNTIGETRQRIRTYIDEIDDFRLWESEESAFRTAGNIKRLNRHKIYNINLANSYLNRTNLNYVILKDSNLNSARINESLMIGANLDHTRLNQTNFENTNLNHSSIKKAFANGANFKGAFLINTDFENTFLIKADFENAILMETNLRYCDLSGANLQGCNLFKADLRGAIGLTKEQLAEVKTLFKAQLDENVIQEMQAFKANLLEKNG